MVWENVFPFNNWYKSLNSCCLTSYLNQLTLLFINMTFFLWLKWMDWIKEEHVGTEICLWTVTGLTQWLWARHCSTMGMHVGLVIRLNATNRMHAMQMCLTSQSLPPIFALLIGPRPPITVAGATHHEHILTCPSLPSWKLHNGMLASSLFSIAGNWIKVKLICSSTNYLWIFLNMFLYFKCLLFFFSCFPPDQKKENVCNWAFEHIKKIVIGLLIHFSVRVLLSNSYTCCMWVPFFLKKFK